MYVGYVMWISCDLYRINLIELRVASVIWPRKPPLRRRESMVWIWSQPKKNQNAHKNQWITKTLWIYLAPLRQPEDKWRTVWNLVHWEIRFGYREPPKSNLSSPEPLQSPGKQVKFLHWLKLFMISPEEWRPTQSTEAVRRARSDRNASPSERS